MGREPAIGNASNIISMSSHVRAAVGPHRRMLLLLLLAAGCGMQSSLDVPSEDVSGAGGSSGLVGSGGATGTGGVVAVPGNGGATSSSATSRSGDCTTDKDHPGYLHCGPWNGYAWTLTTETDMGSTISPSDFSTASGLPFCASGVLARVDSAVGLVGFNVNQAADADVNGQTVMGTWPFTGTGIHYELSNPGGSPIRIQIQGAKGYPDETWCADISGSTSGTVAWSTFNKECWFNFSWEAYDAQTPLEQVMLLVPGANGVEQTFNVCLISLAPY